MITCQSSKRSALFWETAQCPGQSKPIDFQFARRETVQDSRYLQVHYLQVGKVGVYVQVQPMRRLPRQLIYVFAERKSVSASTSLEHIDIRYMLE